MLADHGDQVVVRLCQSGRWAGQSEARDRGAGDGVSYRHGETAAVRAELAAPTGGACLGDLFEFGGQLRAVADRVLRETAQVVGDAIPAGLGGQEDFTEGGGMRTAGQEGFL